MGADGSKTTFDWKPGDPRPPSPAGKNTTNRWESSAPENAPQGDLIAFGASVRWAAESLRRAGYRVRGVDLFGDRDARAACHDFRVAADSASIQSDATRWAIECRCPAMPVGGRAGDDDASSSYSPDRLDLLRRCVDAVGLKFPETTTWGHFHSSGESSRRRLAGDVDWLVKRPGSSGGMGVGPLTSGLDANPSDWVQRRITGRVGGCVAIVTTTATRQLGVTRGTFKRLRRSNAVTRPFVYAGSRGPCAASAATEPLRQLAQRYAREIGHLGLLNIDFIADPNGAVWVLEINARPTASCEVIERHAILSGRLPPGQSLMGWHLDAIAGRTVETVLDDRPPGRGVVKRIVYAGMAGRFDPQVIVLRRADRLPDDHGVAIADVPAGPVSVVAGDPLLTLLVETGATGARSAEQLRRWSCLVRGGVVTAD